METLPPTDTTAPLVATITHQGRAWTVTCRTSFDGVEHIGRLWFAPEDGPGVGCPDRAAIPGRDAGQVMARARRLAPAELLVRLRRAQAEKRRFLALRAVTDEIIERIRFMNRLALSIQGGLIDPAGAEPEMAQAEQQIYEAVGRLRGAAGRTE
jgi:hypothetical protein